MRILLFIFAFALSFSLYAQEDDSYIMFESVYLTIETDDMKAFRDAMREHNATFHAEAPHEARVWHVVSGPDVGKIVWMMGPTTYSDLDTRPSGEDHEMHWGNEVRVHIDGAEKGEFWTRDKDLSNDVGNLAERPIILVRFFKIKRGESYRINGLLEQLSKAVKAAEGENPWYVYWNDFIQGDMGRHGAIVIPFKSWSELDEDWSLKDNFEKAHGEGTFEDWEEGMSDVIEDRYDEFWVIDPYMSGLPMDEE